MSPAIRQFGLTLCTLLAVNLPLKQADASLGHASLNGVIKEYTVTKKQRLKDLVKELYRRTPLFDEQCRQTGSYPTRLEDIQHYQRAVSALNYMNLSGEVEVGQKLVLPYAGNRLCGE